MIGHRERARAAWARLLRLERLEGILVVVDRVSPLCPPGWIGILAVDGAVTATVPYADLEEPVVGALDGLSAGEAVRPEVVQPRLPPTGSVLGPARLLYPPHEYHTDEVAGIELVSRDDLKAFIGTVATDELDESGLLEVTSPVFGSRTASGDLAAVCGYQRWPNDVAHLSVLADPAHRRRGHARRAACAAIRHAMNDGLLPQWRARPPASQALARSLGLVALGAQLNLEPA